MALTQYNAWRLEVNDSASVVTSISELRRKIANASSLSEGRIWLAADAGPRPIWQRVLGAKRYVELFFSIEWCAEYASLIFHDENASEHRVIDQSQPVSPSIEIRSKISHDEVKPCPVDECMVKNRGFLAIDEFLSNGAKPQWVTYRFVR